MYALNCYLDYIRKWRKLILRSDLIYFQVCGWYVKIISAVNESVKGKLIDKKDENGIRKNFSSLCDLKYWLSKLPWMWDRNFLSLWTQCICFCFLFASFQMMKSMINCCLLSTTLMQSFYCLLLMSELVQCYRFFCFCFETVSWDKDVGTMHRF